MGRCPTGPVGEAEETDIEAKDCVKPPRLAMAPLVGCAAACMVDGPSEISSEGPGVAGGVRRGRRDRKHRCATWCRAPQVLCQSESLMNLLVTLFGAVNYPAQRPRTLAAAEVRRGWCQTVEVLRTWWASASPGGPSCINHHKPQPQPQLEQTGAHWQVPI